MNIKVVLLRGRETIAEHRQISNYTSQSGGNYMQDRKLAEYLQQNEVNEVWENFVQATATKTGKTGDALWNEIIDKSMHGSERVDELFKLDGL